MVLFFVFMKQSVLLQFTGNVYKIVLYSLKKTRVSIFCFGFIRSTFVLLVATKRRLPNYDSFSGSLNATLR